MSSGYNLTTTKNTNIEGNKYEEIYIAYLVLCYILAVIISLFLIYFIYKYLLKMKLFLKEYFSNQSRVSNEIIAPTIQEINDFFKNSITPEIENKSSMDSCSICMEDLDYENGDEELYILPCNHIFHKNCIKTFILHNAKNNLHLNCPNCRTELNIV